MAETLSVQMDKILDEYSKRVKNVYNVAAQRVSRECVRKLRNTSPKGSPHKRRYAEGWRAKKVAKHGDVTDIVVHNATNWQLTHLLENGHVIRNKKGTYGRTSPIKHIEPVEEWANTELPEEIERELE